MLYIVGAIALLAFAACSDDKSPTSTSATNSGRSASSSSPSSASSAGGANELLGTSWTLATFEVGQQSTNAVAGSPATLAFNEGDQLRGSTGCNTFGGSYSVNGTGLTLTVGAMTKIGCDPALTAQEATLNQLFPLVTTFAVSGDTLTLNGPQGNAILTYMVSGTSLTDTKWQVTGVNNGQQALQSTTATEQLTLDFSGADAFSGFGGCNQLSSSYTSDGTSALMFGPLVSTQKTCGEEADQLETEYSAALAATRTYEISGNTLTLRDDTGAMQVTATKA